MQTEPYRSVELTPPLNHSAKQNTIGCLGYCAIASGTSVFNFCWIAFIGMTASYVAKDVNQASLLLWPLVSVSLSIASGIVFPFLLSCFEGCFGQVTARKLVCFFVAWVTIVSFLYAVATTFRITSSLIGLPILLTPLILPGTIVGSAILLFLRRSASCN